MKNHPRPNDDPLKQRMVVYRFSSSTMGCLGNYVGMTTMHHSKRIVLPRPLERHL